MVVGIRSVGTRKKMSGGILNEPVKCPTTPTLAKCINVITTCTIHIMQVRVQN